MPSFLTQARMHFPNTARLAMSVVALALAAASGRARGEQAGADAYRRICAECHANPGLVARRFSGLAPEVRRQRWDAFLARHHGGDAEQRAALIRYFESAAQPPR